MARRTKIVLVFCLLIMIFSVGTLGGVLYWINREGSELSLQVSARARAQAQEAASARAQALSDKTTDLRAQLLSFMLTEEKTGDFLTSVETVGRNSGVSLSTDALEVKKQEGLFDTLSVRFSLSGTEGGVLKMLEQLENIPYHSTIQAITIATTKETGARATVEMQVTLLK